MCWQSSPACLNVLTEGILAKFLCSGGSGDRFINVKETHLAFAVSFLCHRKCLQSSVCDTSPTLNSKCFFFFFSQAPCRAELQRALDRLASNTRTHDDLFTIPIPNCDKNGDFHAKQVCECMRTLFMSFNTVPERSLYQHGTGTSEL